CPRTSEVDGSADTSLALPKVICHGRIGAGATWRRPCKKSTSRSVQKPDCLSSNRVGDSFYVEIMRRIVFTCSAIQGGIHLFRRHDRAINVCRKYPTARGSTPETCSSVPEVQAARRW